MKLSRKSGIVSSAGSVFLLLIFRFLTDQQWGALSPILQPFFSLSLLIAGGFATFSFGSLLWGWQIEGRSTTLRLMARVSANPTRNFFAGFLITAYLSLVRPSIATNLSYILNLEWALIALAVYGLYTVTAFSTKESYVSSETQGWKKHAQEVRQEVSSNFVHLTSIMENFVNEGVKEPLLVSLALHLQRIGEREEEIFKILDPLIKYREEEKDNKSHFWASSRKKRELAVINKEAREKSLKALMSRIVRLR